MYKLMLSIKSKTICLLLVILSLSNIQETKASHATGADLTYEFIGNGQYLVTFTFYRDCFGIDAPTTQGLTVSSSSCNFSDFYTMDQVPGTGNEITYNCPTVTSTCAGGTAPGIQQYQYQTIVTLPAQCPDWMFSTSVSSRNAAVTTIVDPDFNDLYIDAFLNNTVSDNSSPYFTAVPIAFECIGQTNYFNHSVIDPEGDSLVYSFIAPRSDANTPLTYETGYSVADPFTSVPSVSIDGVTGDIVMNPTTPEVASVAVLIQEYRNGVIIGSVMRDMQLYIVACSNTLPDVTGINGTTNFATSSCVGGQLCFNVISGDFDGDTLTMTWNQGIPGATFTVGGSVTSPTGQFCWSPTPADARPQPYTFTVTVRDNACPANGVQTVSFSVVVSNMSISLTSTPSVQCFGSHTGSAMASATGNPPLTYIWTFPNGSVLSGQTLSHLYGGNYILNISDVNGCVGTENFTIVEPAPVNVSVSVVNAGCGGSLGSATANVTGGTTPYDYLWTPTGQTTQTATSLSTNTYSVIVTDDHNCTSSASASVTSNTPVNFSINSSPATCLANDGSVTVTHTGGTGDYSYHWSNISDTTVSSQTGLIAGGYTVIATDLGTGCTESLSAIVGNSAGITATITASDDAICETGEDGMATVAASGGQTPYTYLWPNGDTTATTDHLAPGTWLAMVEDYNGCRAYASVDIGFDHPSPSINLGPDTMPCVGTPFTIDAGPGFSSYLWNDLSAGQTMTVSSSGTYSVLVTNSNGCENFDAINVTFVVCAISNNPPGTSTNDIPATVSVYPNPFKDNVNVSITNIAKTDVTTTITDILGNHLYYSRKHSDYGYNENINMKDMAAGIYLIRVEYNGKSNTTRVIKN